MSIEDHDSVTIFYPSLRNTQYQWWVRPEDERFSSQQEQFKEEHLKGGGRIRTKLQNLTLRGLQGTRGHNCGQGVFGMGLKSQKRASWFTAALHPQ